MNSTRLSTHSPYLRFCHCSLSLPLHSQFVALLHLRQYPSPRKLAPLRAPDRTHKSDSWCRPSISSSMASSTPPTQAEARPFSVLFVCLGNICRSPAAEGVFRDIVKKRGLDSKFEIDSAGTIGYHEGNLADPRMRAAAKKRGIEITSISRPIQPSDFRNFDLILAMDKQNREDILGAFERWKFRETLPDDAHKKVKLMCSYCKKHTDNEVPDPYYGGPQGFEKVLDLLEDACESLLDSILAESNS
ncbi:uncharacterized protein LOC116211005 [Punica granatum]|uniref:acid phosphatase n=1 Tax=Punica granatum TaxID=22663 RepID=A0A6P8DUE3_PUNGR|nr:uncharacterized protein LOC116211005 [Punica granatum]